MIRRMPRNRIDRRRPRRETVERVLIVCEGERTEPLYLRELTTRFRPSTARIEGSGTDPRSVVNLARKLQLRERRQGEKFDQDLCVFDRDEHLSFDDACQYARAIRFSLVRSWPCFEYWLRLHFSYTRKPYARTGNGSAAQNCVNELREHLPNYEKGRRGVFESLDSRLETARSRAVRAQQDAVGRAIPIVQQKCMNSLATWRN